MKLLKLTQLNNRIEKYILVHEHRLCTSNTDTHIHMFNSSGALIETLGKGLHVTDFLYRRKWYKDYEYETVLEFDSFDKLKEDYPEYIL